MSVSSTKTLEFDSNNRSKSSCSKSKITIQPRRVGFDFSDIHSAYFYRGNPCISALWVAMSTSFPAGEGEFIRSTKNFEGQITDEGLLHDLQQFSKQEAHHSLQHRLINKLFAEQGYTIEKLEAFYKKELDKRAAKWSDEKRLAHTVVVEHVTAVMANYALTHEEQMAPFPDSIRALFQWHSIEEIEHKSVTFDVYQHCVGDRGLLMRQYYKFIFFEFPLNMYLSSRALLKHQGRKVTWRERRELWRYLFGADGLVSSVKHLYWMFTKRGFHPWNHDDSALVASWKKRLAPYVKSAQ